MIFKYVVMVCRASDGVGGEMEKTLQLRLLNRLEILAQVRSPSASCRAGYVFLLETSSDKHSAPVQDNSWDSFFFLPLIRPLVSIIYVRSRFGSLYVKAQ